MNRGSLYREGRHASGKSRFAENSKQETGIGRLGKPEMKLPLDKIPAVGALQGAAREEKVEIVEEHKRQRPRKVRSPPLRVYMKVILHRQVPKACLFQLRANERKKRVSKLGIEGYDRIRVLQDDPIFTCIRLGRFSRYPIVATATVGGAHRRFFLGFFFEIEIPAIFFFRRLA
jgi:hypothetical protein